jgi:hypothetical protein
MNWPAVSNHNLSTIHPAIQTMNSFKSFPPADDILALIARIDWKQVGNIAVEGISEFLAIVEHIVMFLAALATVLYSKWQENQVTTKLINAAKVSYTWITQVALPWIITTYLWLREVGYPTIRQSALNVYTFTKATWETVSDIYTLATSRQFVNL